ncbi:phosphonate C-P lyase system protein PhnH [Vibrio sp. S9_S30]|uniref:phosphonate C-P lyase system protein PhnH n=1 Tax=Vibrio sp. S9_S30 TaxID=2720226 RepID=UPI0016818637|nr:phosphonate C-P lyase system protein PhnH [Vibrio sp. S9_S30]MBD1559238.1 phosphonate C-P lyase system protein PhnH [Vibrio sp. S9_S30]
MKFVKPGFNDPIHDAQNVFRFILNAMSMPSSLQSMPSELSFGQANAATSQILLTLTDSTTPLWLSDSFQADSELTQNLRFHANTPLTTHPDNASFALINSEQDTDVSQFCWGSEEYPDTSTTVIVQVSSLSSGVGLELSGPGIDGRASIKVEGIHQSLLNQIMAISESQPLGVDVLLTCKNQFMALPRTTRITLANREDSSCTLR